MNFTNNYANRTDSIIKLFRDTFTASEGEEEGDVIAQLVTRMFATISQDDVFVFSALENDKLVGAVFFSQMRYPEEDRTVFILSPMAIATEHHGKGIGQALINHGLDTLRKNGVDVSLTYGDISFYSKVGFAQVSQETAQSPFPLEYPEGWLGQSLTDKTLAPLKGKSTCVEALNDPALW